MSYTPPDGDAVDLNFTLAYGAWNNVHVFGGVVGAQYIIPSGWDVLEAGWTPYVSWRQYILPAGLDSAAFGASSCRDA